MSKVVGIYILVRHSHIVMLYCMNLLRVSHKSINCVLGLLWPSTN